jgi:hypothetical protein
MRIMALLCLSMLACRDEQAGPKNRGGARPPQGAPPAAAAKGQTQALESAPPLTFESGATWANGAVVYLGSIVEPKSPQTGQQVVLRHFFQATGAQPQGYRFFLHVGDADSGELLGNLDHELQNGAAPLGTWPDGKVIEDAHGFNMPNYPGTLRFMLGFWNEQGRLAVDSLPLSDGQGRVKGPTVGSPQLPLPEYRMGRTKTPPTIDGSPDDAVWKSASEVTLVTSNDGKPTQTKTTFRMLYDDAFIYVAFDCEDKDVWGSLFKKDDPIYNEDVVEVFFDADADGKTYNELQVSPHNTNFDASFVARRSNLEEAMKWESQMTTQVKVRGTLDDDKADQGWSAEMKIPIAQLTAVPHVPPQKGDRWRFNAYRLEHFVRRTNIEGQAFSPVVVGDFHNLPRFGWLTFD